MGGSRYQQKRRLTNKVQGWQEAFKPGEQAPAALVNSKLPGGGHARLTGAADQWRKDWDGFRKTQDYIPAATEAAVTGYQNQGYIDTRWSFDINKALYSNPDKDINSAFAPHEQGLKKTALAIQQLAETHSIKGNGIWTRYTSESAASTIYGVPQSVFDDIKNGTPKQRAKALRAFNGIKTVGTSFTSASGNRTNNVFTSMPIERRFYVQDGTKGFVTRNYTESEAIFARGMKTSAFKAEYDGTHIIIHEMVTGYDKKYTK